MKLEINLTNQYWTNYQGREISLYFIGYIEFEENLFNKAEEVLAFILKSNSSGLILSRYISEVFLPMAVGNFAIIIRCPEESVFICDFARTYPLYIVSQGSISTITDHIRGINFTKVSDHLAMEEFLLSGLVTGHRTVFKNVKGILAGELAIADGSKIGFYRYFTLKTNPLRSKIKFDELHIFKQMDELLISVFKRMVRSCRDVNNWIIPLSGGHDSRLIINYLYRLGCKNVICFSYGISSSKEAEYSKQAAETLGFKWYFVEYNSREWENLHRSGLFNKYVNYSFNGCCLPHVQDLLAIYILKRNAIINERDVLVPGHTAFTEAESILVKELSKNEQSIRYVYNKYYNLFLCNKRYSAFEPLLKSLLNEGDQNRNSFPEYFNWQERQSKYINNSVRVYEFYGLRWRIPFWEKPVIDFWQNLNFDDRIQRRVLFDACNVCLIDSVLKNIPMIDKYKKPKISRIHSFGFLRTKWASSLVRILNIKPIIAEGTNHIFSNYAKSVSDLAGSLNLYPSHLKDYIKPIKPRRPSQINYCAAMAIYTLRNEVIP